MLGGTGFLGSRIVRKLCLEKNRPHVLLRSSSRAGRIEDIIRSCRINTGDLLEIDYLQRVIADIQPDIIFYAAGYGAHDGEDNRDEIFSNNLLATHHLLIAAEQVPECRIIYSGTSLGQRLQDKPVKEDGERINPLSFYGAIKTAASILVQQAARYENRLITILNPFAIYGPGEPISRLIPTAIHACINKKQLPVTQSGFVRDYVYVDDVADAYLMAAVNRSAIGETINIAGGKEVSNEEVVTLIETQLGRCIDKQIGVYPPRITDRHHWSVDISKAKQLLAWSPDHTIQQGITKTIDWFKCNGFQY